MVDQQAQRLLADPRSQNMLMDFMGSWLGLEKLYTTVKDDSVYMLTQHAARRRWRQETRGLVLDTFAERRHVQRSAHRRPLVPEQGPGAVLRVRRQRARHDLHARAVPGRGRRATGGILAHASILTGYARADISSPTQRGHLVRTRLLCQYVSPPGASLDTTFRPDPSPTTTRAHYENAHAHGDCATCHQKMDPIGYGFEHYDAFGRWRNTENGYPIDSIGDDLQRQRHRRRRHLQRHRRAGDLSGRQRRSKTCMVRNWSFYAYGSTTWTQDACTYQSIRQASSSGGTRCATC